MPSRAATLPPRCPGPDIMHASNWTTPAAFGPPPSPTERLVGSDSATQIPCSTASRMEPPRASTPRATSLAGLPKGQVETISGLGPPLVKLDSPPKLGVRRQPRSQDQRPFDPEIFDEIYSYKFRHGCRFRLSMWSCERRVESATCHGCLTQQLRFRLNKLSMVFV